MPQDQDWSFPRDTGDFAVDKFVGNQITEDRDAEVGKLFDDPDQPVRWF
jgi:hypothetical protein